MYVVGAVVVDFGVDVAAPVQDVYSCSLQLQVVVFDDDIEFDVVAVDLLMLLMNI